MRNAGLPYILNLLPNYRVFNKNEDPPLHSQFVLQGGRISSDGDSGTAETDPDQIWRVFVGGKCSELYLYSLT